MEFLFLLLLFAYTTDSTTTNSEKTQFCNNLQCKIHSKIKVCGIREEGEGFRLRLFENECELLKYGCQVINNKAYGIINMDYCERTLPKDVDIPATNTSENYKNTLETSSCMELDCPYPTDSKNICGIRKYGTGFSVRLFQNECQLSKYNCETNLQFTITDLHICNGMELPGNNGEPEENKIEEHKGNPEIHKIKNLVVVDGSVLDVRSNISESIDNFFAATHVYDLPLGEVRRNDLNETTRRKLLDVYGPAVVFKPWITIPANKSDDYFHKPTLSTCFHKCPTKCPDTYAPVCGKPGIMAREPSLMFQNHCYMDVAQCKMYWENKSPTARSSAYVESTFLFCLGDEMNALFRFLPLVRTLQHMGRLKKKGYFRYKFKNMRFFNNLLAKEPRLMG